MTIRIRTLALGALVALSTLAACGGQEGTGRVSFVLSSSGSTLGAPAAAPEAVPPSASMGSEDHCAAPQAASVTFTGIVARNVGGELVQVDIPLPATVDLLELVNGKEATLPDGALPAGTYDQLVVVIGKVELTLAGGTKIAITPPGGGWTAIVRVSPPLGVVQGETTTIPLTFRRDLSVGCELGGWAFHPEFECRHH